LAVVRSDLDPDGTVFLKGELWQAVISDGAAKVGEEVEISAVDGFKLLVNAKQGESSHD
jgi:membrane protein implicated in regulation of membrane protease activity